MLCRSIRHNPPLNISSLLTDAKIPTGAQTRQSQLFDQLDIPIYKSNKLSQQCPNKIARIWNDIPCNLKMNVDNCFKKELKKYLLNDLTNT